MCGGAHHEAGGEVAGYELVWQVSSGKTVGILHQASVPLIEIDFTAD